MPSEERPWNYATVRGQAGNIKEAKKYLLTAMHKCKGWSENKELERLLKEIEIE